MFDNITCELPLPNLPLDFLYQHGGNSSEISWQTKDIDNLMAYYKIDIFGQLQLENYEGFWSEQDDTVETSDITSRWEKFSTLGAYTRTNTWWDCVSFTGTINFYNSWYHPNYKPNFDNHLKFALGWVEYKAAFHLGYLKTLELFSVDEPIEYTEEQIQENESKFKLQREELENSHRVYRLEYPTPEQKLIDSIMTIIHSPECVHDEWGMVSKLNTIEDVIIEYRKQFDIWR